MCVCVWGGGHAILEVVRGKGYGLAVLVSNPLRITVFAPLGKLIAGLS